MRKVHIHSLPDKPILAKPIFTEGGNVLLGAGVQLTERLIARLETLGIDQVFIEDAHTDDIIPEDVISDRTRKKAVDLVHSTLTGMINHPQIKGAKTNNTPIGGSYREVFSSIVDDLLSQKELMVNLNQINSLDSYMFHHSVNVAVLSGIIGITLGYNRNQLLELGTGALLFDIGMTKIPREIWNKKGPLTEEEKKIVKTHTIEGYQILKNQHDISLLSAHVALQHHERYNGEGYPRGLKGDAIHEYARIVAIADVYDALTSPRLYRARYSPSEAIEYLLANGNSLFDLRILQKFAKHIAIYPVATTVILSTDQMGVVTQVHQDAINRPTIRIIKEASGQPVNPPYEIDLRQHLDVVIKSQI